MNTLKIFAVTVFSIALAGCSGATGSQPLPVNTGAGTEMDPMQDPKSDAGVATDPDLMAPAAMS